MEEILITPEIRVLPSETCPRLWNLKFRHSRSIVNLPRDKGGRSERDKLDRRLSAKLTVPLSSDARPLVYHSDRQALL